MHHGAISWSIRTQQTLASPHRAQSIDGRAIASDTGRREQLVQLVVGELKQGKHADTVGEVAANFADVDTPEIRRKCDASCSTRQLGVQGWFGDAVIRAEFEETWNDREKEKDRERLTLGTEWRGSFAWRILRAACTRLKEAIYAGSDRYLDVYAKELEEHSEVGKLMG